MEESFSSGKEKLDYQGLVFRQIDRLCFLSANMSGHDDRTKEFVIKLNDSNFNSGLHTLESLLIWKLNEKDRADYQKEKAQTYAEKFASFDLLMKYLPKTGLVVAQRKMFSTGGDTNESDV